ncbi:MAG TPA: hypothetical protein DDY20_13430 [Desulfobulbaceae bacterium]|nr:hypothetical protein [Desulfobulbaceae bacterium]
MANASKMVCSTRLGDNLMTLFSGFNAYAVGMDLMPVIPSGTANQTAFIAVYGRGGRILGTTTISLASTLETFLGLDSKHLILGASVTIFNTPRYECIDNIQFGGFPKDLIFYQTETAFRNATGTLLLEDFSQGQVPDNMDNVCNEPIDSSTNQPGCFWAGDILPGISFQTENSLDPACPACMYVLGRNWGGYGNTTPMIYASTPDPDMLEVSFSGRRVNFVGMKLGVIAVIFVYGTDGTLLGSAVNNFPPVSPLDFWGVASRKPIGRITIYGAILDDIMFGARFPWPMFLPAINSTK